MQTIRQPINFNIQFFASFFLFGICLLQMFYYYKSYLLLILILLLLFCYCLYLHYKFNQFKHLLLWLALNLFSVGLGFSWMWLHVDLFKKNSWLSCLVEGKPMLVQGKIIDVSYPIQSSLDAELPSSIKSGKSVEFDVKIYKLISSTTNDMFNGIPNAINNKVRLKWINAHNNILPGDDWQLYLKLKKPRNFSTYGSFDLEKHLFVQRIEMVGKVINSSKNLLINSNKTNCSINKIRNFIANKINIAATKWHLSKKGIILALGLGTKYDISQTDITIFQDTGTAHLLAISGLHIGFIANLMFLLISFLWKKLTSKQLLEKLPAPIVGSIGSILSAIIYANLAGLSVATKRALMMTCLYFAGIIWCKIINIKQVYFLAIIVILILDPFASLSSSFWLSFWAVGILIYNFKNVPNIVIHNKPRIIFIKIFNLIKTNWIMLVGLLPINGLFFGKICLISCLANFIAIPWVNFLILPWILVGLLLYGIFNITFSKCFFIFADVNLNLLLSILKKLPLIPYATIEIATPNMSSFLISCVGSLWLLTPKGLLNKYLALICFLPLFFSKKSFPQYGDAFVSILDVGQGLATVIQLKDHILLYDTGPPNKVAINYLKSLNHTKIEQAIISHTDLDHIGGLEELIKQQMVKNFSTSVNYKIVNLSASLCQSNYIWHLDGVEFEFLYPEQFGNNINILNKNDNSCVLQMRTNKHRVLFTGDISQKLEKFLVQKYSHKLKSDVLLIPHHGSHGSSSEQFIGAVNPNYAVVSAGYMNIYGHPRREVLDKYLAKKIKILNTIEHGTIDFKLKTIKSIESKPESGTIEYNCYRMTNRKFWNY